MRSLPTILFSRLALLTTSSFLVTFVAIYFFTEKFLTDSMFQEASTSVHLLSRTIESSYLRQLASLDYIVKTGGTYLNDPKSIQNLSKNFLSFDNIYNTLHYYQPNGDLLVAERRASVPAYRSEKNYHTRLDDGFADLADRALQTRKPAASPVLYTSSSHPYQTYVVPHIINGKAKGIFSGGIYLSPEQMGYIVAGASGDPDHVFLVTDEKANILFRSSGVTEENLPYLTKYLISAQKNIASGSSALNSSSMKGYKSFLLASERIPELGFLATYGVSETLINQRRHELMFFCVAGVSLSFLAALLFAFFISNRLSQSLKKLSDSLERISIGDFTPRISGGKNDLFPALSQGIDRVAAKLEKEKTLGDIWSGESELQEFLDKK